VEGIDFPQRPRANRDLVTMSPRFGLQAGAGRPTGGKTIFPEMAPVRFGISASRPPIPWAAHNASKHSGTDVVRIELRKVNQPTTFTRLFISVDLNNFANETDDTTNNTAVVKRAALETTSATY
jgi:hypothetical protein